MVLRISPHCRFSLLSCSERVFEGKIKTQNYTYTIPYTKKLCRNLAAKCEGHQQDLAITEPSRGNVESHCPRSTSSPCPAQRSFALLLLGLLTIDGCCRNDRRCVTFLRNWRGRSARAMQIKRWGSYAPKYACHLNLWNCDHWAPRHPL